VVVIFTAQILVVIQEQLVLIGHRLRFQGQMIQPLFEDGLYAAACRRVDGQRPGTGFVEPVTTVFLRVGQQGQNAAEALFLVAFFFQQMTHHLAGGFTDLASPTEEALR